jgi:hypothetical protein
MSVVWTVTMAANIPADKLARVSGYDGLGSMMGMPVGALVAGPLATRIGVSATQYGAAAITLIASALALIPRDIWTMRATAGNSALLSAAEAAPSDGLAAASVPAEPLSAEPVPTEPATAPALAGEPSFAASQVG